MDVEIIIQAVMGLVAILAVLIFLLFMLPTSKKEKKTAVEKESKPKDNTQDLFSSKTIKINTDLEHLRSIIKDKKSSTEELRKALELIIKYHGTIHQKLGLRAHPDFDPYIDILFSVCRHANADKDMIINFDKSLVAANPEYKKDINEAVTRGLNSRRV